MNNNETPTLSPVLLAFADCVNAYRSGDADTIVAADAAYDAIAPEVAPTPYDEPEYDDDIWLEKKGYHRPTHR